MEGMGRKMNPIDLYYIEDKFNTFSEFEASLSKCDYFVSLSNRIYSQRFRYPSKYPISYEFYNKLNRGELEFTFQIAFSKTFGTTDNKIDISTQNVLYPDETFNVFDNPTVIVYKKNG